MISISLTTFFTMYGLVIRVEINIYAYLFLSLYCKYFFESRSGLFLCDNIICYFKFSFAIVVVLLFIYLIVGFYKYKRINEI